MSESRGIVRSTISTFGVRALLALSVLLLTPYLFRVLGPASFGTWNVVYAIATICSLVEFGFSTGATKLIAELRGASAREELEQTVGTSITLMAIMGVLSGAVIAGVGLLFDGLAASGDEEAFRQGMLLIGATMLIRLPTATYGATLLGYQRANLFNAGESVTAVVFPLGAVAVLESGGGIFGLSAAYALALLAGSLTFAVLLKRTDPSLPLRPRLHGRQTRRRIAGFASLTLLADAMLFVGTRMDTVVIAAIRGAAASAPFAAALKLQSALQSLTFPIYLLFLPMVSELWAAGEKVEVRRRLLLATRIAAQVTLPAALALALFSGDITSLWLGPKAPGVTADIITVLIVSQAITLVVSPAERMLIGIGRIRVIAAIAVVEGISNLGLSIALVSAYGAIGAALGTLFTYGLIAPVKLPIATRATGWSFGGFLRQGLAPALLATLVPAIWMIAARQLLPSEGLRLLVGFAGGLALALAIGVHQVGVGRLRGLLLSRSTPSTGSPVAAEGDVLEY
jgi:O-antigen/teichoic acid export membrane protein